MPDPRLKLASWFVYHRFRVNAGRQMSALAVEAQPAGAFAIVSRSTDRQSGHRLNLAELIAGQVASISDVAQGDLQLLVYLRAV